MSLLAKDSRNYLVASQTSHLAKREFRMTYNLELVLPKFLLLRLVEEWKIPYMVDEDVPEEGQLGVLRRNLPRI
jgi:hypothetical protein